MMGKWNRLLAVLLAASLLTLPTGALAQSPRTDAATPPDAPPAPGAQAEIQVTRDQAIAIARRHFAIPAGLGEPNVGISQEADRAYWTLRWETDDKQPDQIYIHVSIDAVTGWVTGYSYWTTGLQPQALSLSYTREEARELAEDWFGKLVPAEVREAVRFTDAPMAVSYFSDPTYRFNWERVAQGYPVADEGISIAIDARNGDLVDYSLNWRHGRTFTVPEAILGRAEVDAALRPYLGMTLQYSYFTEPGTDEGEWRLVYAPMSGMPYVDQEGRLLGADGTAARPRPEPRPLDPPATAYRRPASPLDRDAALAIAAAALGIADPPSSSAYDETGTDVKRREWSFSWQLEGGGGGYVTVDAEVGVLTQMYAWSAPGEELHREGEEPSVSLAEAEAAALAFVQRFRPDLAGRVVYLPEPAPEEDAKRIYAYHFRFGVLHEGLPVNGWNLSVDVDPRTGAVRSFYSYTEARGKGEFPPAEDVIGVEEALNAYLEAARVRPAWVSFRHRETGQLQQPQLLWASDGLMPVYAIDALTGAPLDWQGRDLIKASQKPADIAGHWAEREIELLWNRGVFDLEDGRFRPDELATAAELARWIVLAKGIQPYPAADFASLGARGGLALTLQRSAESPYFGAAFRAGIMRPEDFPEDFDPNGPVSRELFALWAVRAMGYGRVAGMSARIELDFADAAEVGAKYRNAVALLAGFGILSGDGENRFYPQAPVTRGAAAKILYAVSAEPRY